MNIPLMILTNQAINGKCSVEADLCEILANTLLIIIIITLLGGFLMWCTNELPYQKQNQSKNITKEQDNK